LAAWDVPLPLEWKVNTGLTEEEMERFFKEDDSEPKEGMQKIVLEYTNEDYEKVKAALPLHGKTPEAAVWKLLGL